MLWGDVRLGNLVFDGERRVAGVLDWDLAAIGPREMDLGWHFGLDFMMEAMFGRRVPGFPGTGDALARYEDRTGYEVRDLAWHEVFALVRALAINDRHQRIAGGSAAHGEPDGRHPAGAPGGRGGPLIVVDGRSPSRAYSSTGDSSSSEKPMTPRLRHVVAEGVVGLDEAVGDLAVAGDAAVVLVLAGQPAAHRGIVDVEGLAVHDHLVAVATAMPCQMSPSGVPPFGPPYMPQRRKAIWLPRRSKVMVLTGPSAKTRSTSPLVQQVRVGLEAHAVHALGQRRTRLRASPRL